MIEDDTLVPYLLALNELQNWIMRFIISVSLLVALAFILKYNLIEPYSMSVIEFELKVDQILPLQPDTSKNYEDQIFRSEKADREI